jgi:translation elongation factor EF-Tu-like GTPase
MNLSDHPFLFTVSDRFAIDGRGTVLVPGVPWEGVPTVKRGDPVILRTPLGEIIETTIEEVERMMGSRIEASPHAVTFKHPKVRCPHRDRSVSQNYLTSPDGG